MEQVTPTSLHINVFRLSSPAHFYRLRGLSSATPINSQAAEPSGNGMCVVGLGSLYSVTFY